MKPATGMRPYEGAVDAGRGFNSRTGGAPQQVCTALTGITQAFVTLSTHQPESAQAAICYAEATHRKVRTRRYGQGCWTQFLPVAGLVKQ
jgi:hypothetical protein